MSDEPSPKRMRFSPAAEDAPWISSVLNDEPSIIQEPPMPVEPTIQEPVDIQPPLIEHISPIINTSDQERTDHERMSESIISAPSIQLPLLCRTTHTPSYPLPTQNLFNLYSLDSLASTVARYDPTTGAKINKLRKSYEGKVKKQDLLGRNKPTHIEGELMGFLEWPDEGWFDQRVYGRELEHATDATKGRLWKIDEGDDDPKSKIVKALHFSVGKLAKHEDEKWRALLGLDDSTTTTTTNTNVINHVNSSKQPSLLKTGNLAPTVPTAITSPISALGGFVKYAGGFGGTGMRSSAPASPVASRSAIERPDRLGKKRRYDDASFEGYDNGWVDDGYDTADGAGGRRIIGGSAGGVGGPGGSIKRRRVSTAVS